MNEADNFYNDGFGWVCRRCEAAVKAGDDGGGDGRSRLLTEGETESKSPRLSHTALARWRDRANRILECPACGTAGKV